MKNKNEGENLIDIKLYISEDGVIKPHASNPEIQLKHVPSKGDLYWDYPTNDVYEISYIMHHDLDVRILITKVSDSGRFIGMMQH